MKNDHINASCKKKCGIKTLIKYSNCTLRIRLFLTLHSVCYISRIGKFMGMNKTEGFSEIIFTKSNNCWVVFVAYNLEINIKQRLIIVPKHVTSICRVLSYDCLNHCIPYTFTLMLYLISYLVFFVFFVSTNAKVLRLPIVLPPKLTRYHKFPQGRIVILLLFYHVLLPFIYNALLRNI